MFETLPYVTLVTITHEKNDENDTVILPITEKHSKNRINGYVFMM